MHNDKGTMQPFFSHTGRVAALQRANVDNRSDHSKQFLKRVERTGFGAFLFYDWRHRNDGHPQHPSSSSIEPSRGAQPSCLCGELWLRLFREHAPWRSRIRLPRHHAPSFVRHLLRHLHAERLLPVVLPETAVAELFHRCGATREYE